jgi:hypothetical protein
MNYINHLKYSIIHVWAFFLWVPYVVIVGASSKVFSWSMKFTFQPWTRFVQGLMWTQYNFITSLPFVWFGFKFSPKLFECVKFEFNDWIFNHIIEYEVNCTNFLIKAFKRVKLLTYKHQDNVNLHSKAPLCNIGFTWCLSVKG